MGSMFTLPGITRAQIENLSAKLMGSGALMTEAPVNQWLIQGHGVSAKAQYDPNTSVLTVTVNQKPFFVSIEHIEEGLKAQL